MKLGVNIDHVATLRNARGLNEPDVVNAALLCENAGADAITVHLREDRRHIKDNDVFELKKAINIRMNLEMAPTEEMRQIALKLMPQSVCIVPEKRQELTTEGGLDVYSSVERLREYIRPFLEAGIFVSLFINPESRQIKAAQEIKAPYIELHTGQYAEAADEVGAEIEFQRLKRAADFATQLGLKVNAGHGLNYENVKKMHLIKGLNELNIGHTIISRAVFVGLEKAVREMRDLIV